MQCPGARGGLKWTCMTCIVENYKFVKHNTLIIDIKIFKKKYISMFSRNKPRSQIQTDGESREKH